MDIRAKLILWLLSLAVVMAGLYGVYRYGRHVELLEQAVSRDRAVQAQQEQNRLALLAYAKTITEAGAQHDQDQTVVNRLAADLQRLRIHIPTCPMPGTAEAGVDSGGGGRLFSERVDAAFADLQAGVGKLVQRCDQLNIDARRMNATLP